MEPVGHCPQCGSPIYREAVVKELNSEACTAKVEYHIDFSCPCHEWLQKEPKYTTLYPGDTDGK